MWRAAVRREGVRGSPEASRVVGGLRSGVLGINPRINYIQEQHIQDQPDRTHRINRNARCSASVGHRASALRVQSMRSSRSPMPVEPCQLAAIAPTPTALMELRH